MRFKTNSRLLAQLPAFCWTTDEALLLTSSFGGMLDRVGAAQGTLVGSHIRAIFTGEQWERIKAAHERALVGEETAFDFVWYGRSLHAQLAPLFGAEGPITGIIGVAVDATDGEKLEEALRKTEAALATAEYIAHLGSWSHDFRTGEVWWSDELYRILDISSNEHPKKRGLWNFDHPDDSALIELTITHAMSQRMPYSIEHRIVRPSGEVRTVLEQADCTFDHAGNRVHEVGTILDITERVKAQTLLARVQSSFADAQRIAAMGTWDANLETGEIWWSPELYNILGIEPGVDLKLGELWRYDHPDDRERVRATSENARRLKESYSVIYRVVRPNGEERRVLERGADFYDWKGDRVRNIGVVIDITEEKVTADQEAEFQI
ncbi:MAG: PAS domain-containing protein [Candidatus Eremiobacteraeota bacterium]|nr:PAS domain-containing protein [Candidatus Eremiobacteraeota bacterium]